MKLITRLEKAKDTWFLIVILLFFFVLRLPSLFEPYWYGDEGIYEVIGYGLRNGRMLYTEIFDNKTPLLYLVYAFFNGDQFGARFTSMLAGMVSVIAFYLLAKLLSPRSKIGSFLTIAYAVLLGLPFLEGNIANAENFMLAPTLIAAYLIFKDNLQNEGAPQRGSLPSWQYFTPTKQHTTLIVAGFLLALSFLFKIVAIFDVAAFFIFTASINLRKHATPLPIILQKLSALIVGFVPPILLTFLFFLLSGAFPAFFYASFVQNVGYVGYGNTFIIPQGFLFIKVFLLALYCLFLYKEQARFSHSFLFVAIWFAFSLFNAFFSQRPYTHYLLVLLPSYLLFCGIVLSEKRLRILTAVVLLIISTVIYNYFNLYTKNTAYYQNALAFVTGQKSVNEFQSFFDRNTPNDYLLSSYILSHRKSVDDIFIWGNNAQLYRLTNTLPPGRFIVAYHITATPQTKDETEKALKEKMPRFIILTNRNDKIPFMISGYEPRLHLGKSLIYERSL